MSNQDTGAAPTMSSEAAPSAKCPVLSHTHAATGSMANQHWWPDQLNLRPLGQELAADRPHGRGLRLRRGVRDPRPRRGEGRHRRGDDDVAGLVAGRLRPLRPAVHPHGVAQRRHLPHRRRAGRCGLGDAALRPAQQLARQRQPRQGPPPALAGQAEVRPEDLLGRPDGPRRELRPGVDGLQDVRLRRRPRGRLGARGGHLLGPEDDLARRRALQRRPRARRIRSAPCRWA